MQMPFGMIPQVYLMDPPPGYTRQPENPPSSAGGVVPAGATLTGFALIIVVIRIFTRKWVVKGPLGADDCMSFYAFACSWDDRTNLDRSMHIEYDILLWLFGGYTYT